MTTAFRFVHSSPQHAIASILRDCLLRCRSASIVAGFMTPDGIEALRATVPEAAQKIAQLVIGAGTYKALQAIDVMRAAGLADASVKIHLGHSRPSGGRKHPFVRYHPMLHSKVYLFDMADGTSTAFVGSHNVTGFALRGLNGEAGVLLEGPSADGAFEEIRQHISHCFAQATPYDPTMKDAYAWWTREYFDGLQAEANDAPRDGEGKRTIIVLAAVASGSAPARGDRIYFEIPAALTEIRSLDAEVHLHLFDVLPASPNEALSSISSANHSLACRLEAIDANARSAEMNADWFVDNARPPQLKRTARPFRPKPAAGMQQVRARIEGDQTLRFDYLFEAGRSEWFPEFSEELRESETESLWYAVSTLSDDAGGELLERSLALRETSPESGSFVLYSRRRRRRAS